MMTIATNVVEKCDLCCFGIHEKLLKIRENVYSPSRNRSSPSQMFLKVGVLKKFEKFTGKYLCQSQFLKKVAPS